MRYEVITRPKAGYVFPKIISFDTEYSCKNVRKAELLSISIGVSPDLTYILEDFSAVKRFIKDAEIILTWNGVVDLFIVGRYFNEEFDRSKMVDGMLMEHLVDERLPHGLGDFALREYNDDYKNEFWGKYQAYQDAPKEEAYEYEKKDGCYTYRAGAKYLDCLRGKMGLVSHVHRLQWALFDSEIQGLKVNTELMVETKKTMGPQIEALKTGLGGKYINECNVWELDRWADDIRKLSSDRGKVNRKRPKFGFSDPQLQWLIYDILEYPVMEMTKKKNPSTKVKALKELNELKPGLEEVIQYKSLKAAYPTFVVGMLERVEDNRIYPTFFVNGTDTGRISSSAPNMQNMPREGVFRNFFIPDDDHLIIGADFTGLEVGVEANLTEDPALLRIMLDGANKHDITAEAVGMKRQDAKTLNFLCQYGGGVWKIQKTFGVSAKTAQEIYDRYWQAYSGVKAYKERVFKELEETSEVTNCFGRTRHFNKPENDYEKGKQQRQAYSHMVQGPGAEMNNAATYLVSEHFKQSGIGRLLMPIHDELVCQVRKTRTDEAISAIIRLMESTNDVLGFKYKIAAKAYGPLSMWSKA